jgi:hypothetical protein
MIVWASKPLPPINLYNYHMVPVVKYEKRVKDKLLIHKSFIDLIPIHKTISLNK